MTSDQRPQWTMRPEPDGTCALVDARGGVVAIASPENLLRTQAPATTGGPLRVRWSGWLGDQAPARVCEDGGTSPVFAPDFATWSGKGLAALFERLDAWPARDEVASPDPVLWPHHRHVLSDAQSCATLLRRTDGPEHAAPGRTRPGLLLEPAALLTESMLAAAEEHITRIMATLADLPSILTVVVSDVRRVQASSEQDLPVPMGPDLVCCPLGAGELGEAVARDLVLGLAPPGVPVVIR